MFDQQHLMALMQRGLLVLCFVCALSVLAHAGTSNPPSAINVSAITTNSSTRITIYGSAPMAYSVTRPDAHNLIINLPGVDASRLAQAYNFASPLVASVTVDREQGVHASPGARLFVLLRAPVHDRSQMSENDLILELTPDGAASSATSGAALATASNTVAAGSNAVAVATPTPTPTPSTSVNISSASQSSVQSSQGKQYGQAGFVGEPINLNVVNADIRDILNYITESYGVNFVIDNSVGAVPVTVNVSDVPWNIALDAILRANRLGVDVNGNILRVATQEVLAAEASTQQRISEARLNGSPLVTEFIRLNYARASGSLQSTAGSAGGFAGGQASGSTAGVSIGGGSQSSGAGASSGGGDQGILPIIQRRLSKRGGVEVDSRSNTLIVTDVEENIAAVRQLIALLDQPEPQVEIETRIVIANRNFSRDLGVQLSAVALNTNRGGVGSFSTLPANQTAVSSPNIFGNVISTQPVGGLAAAAATTVIGLTTGVIGTAQISALITAAETRGTAKVVATPRVTALNNRTAQIESGQQIPVQTSLGTSGATVVSTTFVSVPLRLSITPQITDVGTVVLRVTVENNSLNSAIAVGGVPGIDTQRMQSEVLVPDGGTTVMGGVLADSEGETRQRTPGIASVPVLGNLFKRKLTTRQTTEILFFITPRIYRPDYLGRQTSGTVSTGTRSTTISQPVPLGNPTTNTPPPGQQMQQNDQQQQTVTPLIVQPVTPTTTPARP